jgi:predicted acyltransferase
VTTTASAPTRLISLDVFRGLTMASMVIVNNPGDWGAVYAPLLHAEWHGWTPTDLIFPYFLFIVGVSMTLSKGTLGHWGRILRRAALIAGLGLLLAGFPWFPLATWRIPGVLQRIAVCYLAAVCIFRATKGPGEQNDWRHTLKLGWCVIGLLVGYAAIMLLVPVPGGGAGDLSPNGNVGAFIDRTLMGNHLWQRRPWDPEGVLSTIPAIGTTLLGVMTGLWLRARVPASRRVLGLLGGGVVLMILGQLWHLSFPINKNLWTSSYVLFTAGAAEVTLAVCYWLIDVRGWKRWSWPFVILGSNALALFVLSGFLTKVLINIKVGTSDGKVTTLYRYLYVTLYAPLLAPKNASLLFALTHLVVLFGVLYVMYRRRIFLKA